jgi:hypothetical protein
MRMVKATLLLLRLVHSSTMVAVAEECRVRPWHEPCVLKFDMVRTRLAIATHQQQYVKGNRALLAHPCHRQ